MIKERQVFISRTMFYSIDENTYNAMYSFVRDELEKFSQKVQHEIEERNDVIAQIQEFM